MRTSSTRATALALASLLAAPPALAASGYFLEIEGVKGESTARAAAGPVQVESFSWGATQGKSSVAGVGGAGKVNVQDLSVSKHVQARDAGSGMATGKRQPAPAAAAEAQATVPAASVPAPQEGLSFVVNAHDNPNARALLAACASGQPIPRAFLTGDGQRYELKDVVVVSCNSLGTGSEHKIVTRTGHVTLMK